MTLFEPDMAVFKNGDKNRPTDSIPHRCPYLESQVIGKRNMLTGNEPKKYLYRTYNAMMQACHSNDESDQHNDKYTADRLL